MSINNCEAILKVAFTNSFNGIFIIPTILAVTLVMEVDAAEDYSPIVPTTYDGSELDTEGQTMSTNYRSDLMTDSNPNYFISTFISDDEFNGIKVIKDLR